MQNTKCTDITTEKLLLGGIINYGSNAYLDIAEIISWQSFYDDNHQILWQLINSIFADDINIKLDIPVILLQSKKSGFDKYFNENEIKYLHKISQQYCPDRDNITKLAKQLAKLEIARRLQKEAISIHDSLNAVNGTETINNILSLAENPIYNAIDELTTNNQDNLVSISEGLEAFINHLAENPVDIIGISTGFPNYDKAIGGGLRRKTVNVLAARPKQGKTILVDTMAVNIATRGIPVLNLDTEMGKQDHWIRMVANISGVPINDLETGKFAHNQFTKNKVFKASKQLESLPYTYASIAGKSFDEILSIMRRWIMRKVGKDEFGNTKSCVVFYDYLKLMNDRQLQNMQEYQALGFQISKLHDFSVKYDLPIVSFVQLNRDGIDRESTDVVSGSDRIIWLCSNFSILKNKSADEIAEDGPENGVKKLVPLVARHGKGMEPKDYINIHFNGSIAQLREGFTKYQIMSGLTNTNTQDQIEIITDDEQIDL